MPLPSCLDEGRTQEAKGAQMSDKKKAPHSGGAKRGNAGQHSAKRIDIPEVARAALGSIDAIFSRWLPNGKRQGREYVTTNPTRSDAHTGSFSVNTESGLWADFATDDKGGDLVSLVAYLDGVTQLEAAKRVAAALGLLFSGGDNRDSGDNTAKSRASKGHAADRPSSQEVVTPLGQVGTNDEERPLLPIPAQASSPPAVHPRHGKPSAMWTYRDATGGTLFHVYRFDPKGGRKQILPLSYWPNGWQWKGVPVPRPLYHLDQLAARPDAPVIVCEGEKAADAAARLAPDHVTTTAPNGAQSPEKADWAPLKGRHVVIWPDADEAGAGYAAKVAELARQAGAATVAVVDLAAFATAPDTGISREIPKGWDAADAEAEGWSPTQISEALKMRATRSLPAVTPPAHEIDGADLKPYFEPTGRGVFYHGVEKDMRLPALWICSPLYVAAYTRDERGENWGRLLEFTDRDSNRHTWAAPQQLHKGSGEELRGELLRLGVEITTHQYGRRLFGDYLQQWRPDARALCVSRTGWHRGAYVFPDRTIGDAEERVFFQSETLQGFAYGQRGTLEQWRDAVSVPCAGNSRLVFALSVSFASILLDLAGDESGGFHLRGGSSSGKTTALRVAASVFGGPDYMQRWRATDNGLEALAEQHNDALLILDELAQIDPKAAGETAYMLANGSGKARADRGGAARVIKRWRLLFLSAGEIGLAEHMAQAGKRTKAGQEIRMADIPADAGAGLGLFENLHNFTSGAAFSRALADAAAAHYGAASLAFIEAVKRSRADLPDTIKRIRSEFVKECIADEEASGQVQRVASRFGLVAVAGELATAYGLTGWQPHEAEHAAHACFNAWLEARGGAGDQEEASLLRQVRHFFEAHGEARFTPWERAERQDDHAPRTSNRAGFVRRMGSDGALTWYVLPEVFRAEICEGFDYRWAEKALLRAHMIKAGNDGRGEQRKETLPGFKGRVRCYVFSSIDGEDE